MQEEATQINGEGTPHQEDTASEEAKRSAPHPKDGSTLANHKYLPFGAFSTGDCQSDHAMCLDCGSKNDTVVDSCQICGHSGERWSSLCLEKVIDHFVNVVAARDEDINFLQRQLVKKTEELRMYAVEGYKKSDASKAIAGDLGSLNSDAASHSDGGLIRVCDTVLIHM